MLLRILRIVPCCNHKHKHFLNKQCQPWSRHRGRVQTCLQFWIVGQSIRPDWGYGGWRTFPQGQGTWQSDVHRGAHQMCKCAARRVLRCSPKTLVCQAVSLCGTMERTNHTTGSGRRPSCWQGSDRWWCGWGFGQGRQGAQACDPSLVGSGLRALVSLLHFCSPMFNPWNQVKSSCLQVFR